MAEVKNTFLKSKMNKDLDSRIVPSGEYRDAQNVSINRSDDSDVGAVENTLSNILITDIKSLIVDIEVQKSEDICAPTGFNATSADISLALSKLEIIGEFVDVKNNKIFLMLTNYTDTSPDRLSNFASGDEYDGALPPNFQYKGAGCYICQHDMSSNMSTILVGGNFLNFSKTHPVLGIDLLEDLLFWTDNRNQPRKINVKRAFNEPFSSNSPYYYNEDHISVAKFAPVLPISLIEETHPTIWKSTMISASEQYLPVHLIDTLDASVLLGAITFDLTRSHTFGSTSDFLNVGDKVTIPDQPGDDIEMTIASIPAGNQIVVSAPGAPEAIASGTKIKFQRENPDYDSAYTGDESVLKEKFSRFSYRFKYDDNEYSLFAPFTQAVFIPQQYGYFINEDESRTGESGVVDFMENLVDKVKFNIRLPVSGTSLSDMYKVKEVQIVSKASNELTVKVIDDIEVSNIPAGQDYIYEYNSLKPYKTLPEKEITRVHDKVPIRAQCQEVISNRVIYGNYVDRHSSVDHIDYEVKYNIKDFNNIIPGANFSQIRTEYPNHTLKQNRSYSVGIVLVDRYGRASDIISSLEDINTTGFKNSTIYLPYNANGNSILDFPGNILQVQFNQPIPTDSNIEGYPGLYLKKDNPLGWYSYKIVIKQQEQEYYNVYVAGVLGGEITWDGETQPSYSSGDRISTISLFGDNINKVPRELSDAGPIDSEFGSNVKLFNRVNPNSWSTALGIPYNTQSNIQRRGDTVTFIKPFKELGKWASTKGNKFAGVEGDFDATTLPAIDPWYPFHGVVGTFGGFVDPLFKSNENALIANISNNFQVGVTPQQISGFGFNLYGPTRIGDTTLGVYETNPTESNLELFWETSTSGFIRDDGLYGGSDYQGLNDLIVQGGGADGAAALSDVSVIFNEGDAIGSDVTNYFECLNASGNPIADPTNVLELKEVIDGLNNLRTEEFEIHQDPFNLPNHVIRTKDTFIYNYDANQRENYTFYINATMYPSTPQESTNTLSFNGSLSNVAPINVSFPTYSSGYYFTFQYVNDYHDIVLPGYFVNGSANTTRNIEQLVYTIDFPIVSAGDLSNHFSFIQLPSGVVRLTYNGGLGIVNNAECKLRVTDAGGNGDPYINPITGFSFHGFGVTVF